MDWKNNALMHYLSTRIMLSSQVQPFNDLCLQRVGTSDLRVCWSGAGFLLTSILWHYPNQCTRSSRVPRLDNIMVFFGGSKHGDVFDSTSSTKFASWVLDHGYFVYSKLVPFCVIGDFIQSTGSIFWKSNFLYDYKRPVFIYPAVPVNILAEREIGKKVRECSPGICFGVWHHLKSQGPPSSLPRFPHMIYTNVRGHQFWIKIGKKLAIVSTKCSLLCKKAKVPAVLWLDSCCRISPDSRAKELLTMTRRCRVEWLFTENIFPAHSACLR